jgi:hypothetical protein
MDFIISMLLIIGACFVLAFAWFKLSHDPVGKKQRARRTSAGLQGRVDEWLYWQAPVTKPPMKKIYNAEPMPTDPPWLRALQTLIRQEAAGSNVAPEAAYAKLVARHRAPLPQAFLKGQVQRAIRTHWRRQYRGPDGLFFVWLYLVAYPRHGRRHLYLDSMSAALKEMRTP